jgi:hypothetical protein
MVLLQIGGANRALRGTEANEASSRSHALLQLSIEVEIHQEGGSTVIRKSKLNLVRPCTRGGGCSRAGGWGPRTDARGVRPGAGHAGAPPVVGPQPHARAGSAVLTV